MSQRAQSLSPMSSPDLTRTYHPLKSQDDFSIALQLDGPAKHLLLAGRQAAFCGRLQTDDILKPGNECVNAVCCRWQNLYFIENEPFLFFFFIFLLFVDKNSPLVISLLIPLTASGAANAAPLIEKGAFVQKHPQLKDN